MSKNKQTSLFLPLAFQPYLPNVNKLLIKNWRSKIAYCISKMKSIIFCKEFPLCYQWVIFISVPTNFILCIWRFSRRLNVTGKPSFTIVDFSFYLRSLKVWTICKKYEYLPKWSLLIQIKAQKLSDCHTT